MSSEESTRGKDGGGGDGTGGGGGGAPSMGDAMVRLLSKSCHELLHERYVHHVNVARWRGQRWTILLTSRSIVLAVRPHLAPVDFKSFALSRSIIRKLKTLSTGECCHRLPAFASFHLSPLPPPHDRQVVLR